MPEPTSQSVESGPLPDRQPREASARVAQWRDESLSPSLHAPRRTNWNLIAEIGSFVVAIACAVVGQHTGMLFAGALGVVLLVAARVGTQARIATPEDIDMLEENTDAWMAELEIEQNGVVTGRDRGTIFFEQGALGFNGHHTSFVISSEEVEPVQDGRRIRGEALAGWYSLQLVMPEKTRWRERKVFVRFGVLRMPSTLYTVRDDRFREQFGRFRTQPPSLDGEFPPLSFGPGRDHGRQDRTIGAFAPLIPMAGFLVFILLMLVNEVAPALAFLCVGAPVLFFLWSVAKEHRDRFTALRMIEREEAFAIGALGTTVTRHDARS